MLRLLGSDHYCRWNAQQQTGFSSVPRAGDAVAVRHLRHGPARPMLKIYNYMTSGILLPYRRPAFRDVRNSCGDRQPGDVVDHLPSGDRLAMTSREPLQHPDLSSDVLGLCGLDGSVM